MAKRDESEERVDELYREHPDQFVERRDNLARDLKTEGDGERAAEVKGLRRPTNAAFVVNRLGHEHQKDVKALVDAGDELRSAYESGDSDRMRAAAADERDAVNRLVSLAEDEAGRTGIAATATLMNRITETLQAVTGDEETRRLVESGRLDRERKVATLGFPMAAPAGGKRKQAAASRKQARKPTRELEAARKELKRVGRELGTARRRAERADAAVKRAEGKLADARDEATSAGDAVTELEAEAKQLEKRISALE
jgi:hypothetical protein